VVRIAGDLRALSDRDRSTRCPEHSRQQSVRPEFLGNAPASTPPEVAGALVVAIDRLGGNDRSEKGDRFSRRVEQIARAALAVVNERRGSA
jgi:hypothetical protein